MSDHNESRRKFIKATAYTAPVILTLKAAPTFATSGSMKPGHRRHHGRHGQHHGRRHGRHHGNSVNHRDHGRRGWWR